MEKKMPKGEMNLKGRTAIEAINLVVIKKQKLEEARAKMKDFNFIAKRHGRKVALVSYPQFKDEFIYELDTRMILPVPMLALVSTRIKGCNRRIKAITEALERGEVC